MKAILKKELKQFFLTPKGFIFLSVFTFLSGFIFLSLIEQFNPSAQKIAMLPNQSVSLNEQVLTPHLTALRVLLLFFVPLLTMKSFAGEREQETFPLLLVSPASTFGIVCGKFVGVAVILALFCGVQIVFPISLSFQAPLELPPLFVGLFGLYLLALSYGAVAFAISALSHTQIVAGAFSFLVLFLFHSAEAFTSDFSGGLSAIVQYLSPNMHLDNLLRGLLKSSDIFYFIGFIAASLSITYHRIDLERGS